MDLERKETLIEVCTKILGMRMGDRVRIENIRKRAEEGKILYQLDKKYLERLSQYIKYEPESQSRPQTQSRPQQNQSSFCGACGTQIPAANNFCTNCGAKKIITTPQTPPQTRFQSLPRKSKKENLAEYEKKYISRIETGEDSPNEKTNAPPPHEPPTKEIPRQRTYSQNDDGGRYERSRQRPADWKSEAITLICSIVGGLVGLQGIGYIYLGKIGKGVGYLIGSIILYIAGIALIFTGILAAAGAIMLIIYFVMFVWQIIDSYKLCKKYNDYYEEFGRAPNW